MSIYIYTIQTKLVQCTPSPSPNYFGGKNRKKETKEKKCVIYFVHVYTSKKTF